MRAILITLSSVFYAAAIFVAAAALMIPAGSPPPAPPAPPDHLLEESLDRIAREQAVNRELVADLNQTITVLQSELTGNRENDTIKELAREQAANRELVTNLNQTITALQRELAQDRESDTIGELTREQAASRELIADLRESITALQQEVKTDIDAGAAVVEAPTAPGNEKALVETGAESVGNLLPGEIPGGEVSAETAPGRVIAIIGGGLFESGKDVLTADLRSAVEKVVPVLILNPGHRVSIEGHADSRPIGRSLVEKYDDNRTLSLSRAKLIAGLIEKQGVSGEQITVIGYGDTRPLASNITVEGRAENRRVEIRLIPPAEEPGE